MIKPNPSSLSLSLSLSPRSIKEGGGGGQHHSINRSNEKTSVSLPVKNHTRTHTRQGYIDASKHLSYSDFNNNNNNKSLSLSLSLSLYCQRRPEFQKSPGESLLDEIDIRLMLPLTDHQPDIVTQRAATTDRDAHGADLAPHLAIEEGADVGTAGEHLDRGAGGVDLLGVARARDPEHDAEAVAAPVHGEDGRHPRTDPFEVLGRLDDPHEDDLASRDRAVGVAGDEVAHVRHLVRDANAAGEEHHGAVGVHRVRAPVGSFDVHLDVQALVGGVRGFLEEGLGHSGALADDE